MPERYPIKTFGYKLYRASRNMLRGWIPDRLVLECSYRGNIRERRATMTDFPHLLSGYPFSLDSPKNGQNEINCEIWSKAKKLATLKVTVTKLPPKSNAVKIDRLTGGLIVDDLPFFPYGFYCYSPVQPTLSEEEVVNGFNMMSPYQKITAETREERQRYLDRCAELGMKVHYNLLSLIGGGGVRVGKIQESKKQQELQAEMVR